MGKTTAPFRLFLQNNSLTLCMFGLFLVFLIGLSVAGHFQMNNELASHDQAARSYSSYITSGEFIEAVFENWESEFLQMAALVIATIFLRQKGATDSKKIRGHNAVDVVTRHSLIQRTLAARIKAASKVMYANSLSIALVSLFIVSFILHAVGGVAQYNHEAAQHGEQAVTIGQYVVTPQFWFESFQNWQSEFLAVGTLLLLSVFLRQQGSPESKPVAAPNTKTGE